MPVCVNCNYYNDNDRDNWGDGYCAYYGRHFGQYSSSCSHFEAVQGGGSGCFLTTMACNIYHEEDDGHLLSTLRNFRDNVLEKSTDPQHIAILKEYDVLGPMISFALYNDLNREEVVRNNIKGKLHSIVYKIEALHYEDAILEYIDMTLSLKKYYNINM